MKIVIERAENGYEVEMTDPKIEKANQSSKGGMWRDPMRSYVFSKSSDVIEFVRKNIDKLASDAYGDAFAAAVSASETDD